MTTPADTYIAITETYWTRIDTRDGNPVAIQVYETIGPQVEGFVGIWREIEKFADALEAAFEWDETEFIDTVEEYVPKWQDLILERGEPVTFQEVHLAIVGQVSPTPSDEGLED